MSVSVESSFHVRFGASCCLGFVNFLQEPLVEFLIRPNHEFAVSSMVRRQKGVTLQHALELYRKLLFKVYI